MRSSVSVSPRHRELVLVLVALALVTAPLWTGRIGLGDPQYTYERAAVTTDDGTIEYADPNDSGAVSGPLSEDIGCQSASDLGDLRFCAMEASIASNETNVTITHTNGSEPTLLHQQMGEGNYRYLSVNGGIYEPTVTVGQSSDSERDNRSPVYLALDRVDPEEALRDVSIDESHADVPPAVARAAESGSKTTRTELEIPQTPIRLEDGSYYRVYLAETAEPGPAETLASPIARFVAPLAGLLPLALVSRRARVTSGGRGADRRS